VCLCVYVSVREKDTEYVCMYVGSVYVGLINIYVCMYVCTHTHTHRSSPQFIVTVDMIPFKIANKSGKVLPEGVFCCLCVCVCVCVCVFVLVCSCAVYVYVCV